MVGSPAMSPLALLSPVWLGLLPVPWLARAVWRHRPREPRLVSPGLETWALRSVEGDRLSALAWPLAWGALVLALGRPVFWPPGTTPRDYRDIATIVDISPSMAARDVLPDRLSRAAREWRRLIPGLPPTRASLTAFSAEAYRLLPLSKDLDIVADYIEGLSPAMTRRRGSNLAQALEVAASGLRDSPRNGRAILLFSDGEVRSPRACERIARRFAEEGLPILILGIGQAAGAAIDEGAGRLLRDPATGRVHVSRLDARLLKRLARLSGGVYIGSHEGADGRQRLVEAIEGLAARPLPGLSPRPIDLAPVCLVLAAMCLAWPIFRPVSRLPGTTE